MFLVISFLTVPDTRDSGTLSLLLSVLCAVEPGGRGPPETPGGLREGQRRREAHEHRQQAESGPRSHPASTASGKTKKKKKKVSQMFKTNSNCEI